MTKLRATGYERNEIVCIIPPKQLLEQLQSPCIGDHREAWLRGQAERIKVVKVYNLSDCANQ